MFRKDLLTLLESSGYETSKYTFEAGKDNVFTLKSKIFKRFIENSSIFESGDKKLYKLYFDKKLYGFLLKGKSENIYQLVSPRNLSNLLKSLFSGNESIVEVLSEIENPIDMKLEEIISIYKENLVDWFIPDHTKFLKYFEEKFKLDGSFSIEEVAKVNIKTEMAS